MTEQETDHAKKVVDRFREMVGENISLQMGNGHWDELTLLVESAIDASVLAAEEQICDKLESLVREIRADAERFDHP